MALRLDSDRRLPSSLCIANKWPGFCRCGALEGPYATRPRGGRRCTRFVLGSCLGFGLARRVILFLGPWFPGGSFRACAPQTFFRRSGPSAPATVGTTTAQAPGIAPQPRCSRERGRPVRYGFSWLRPARLRCDLTPGGIRAAEDCMMTQLPSRCGRPLTSILSLGTDSRLPL